MKWTGNPETDWILSLSDDDADVTILGQVARDSSGGWNAFYYPKDQVEMGHFETAELAQQAVDAAVRIGKSGSS